MTLVSLSADACVLVFCHAGCLLLRYSSTGACRLLGMGTANKMLHKSNSTQ